MSEIKSAGRKRLRSGETYVAVVSFPLTAVFTPRALGHRRILKVAKTLRSLGDHLQVGTSVRNVYGDPVNVGGRTVIPIARVSYGFGAGGSEEVKSGARRKWWRLRHERPPGRGAQDHPRPERASFHSSTRRVSAWRSWSDS